MKLSRILREISPIEIMGEIDIEKDVCIAHDVACVNECSLLFLTRRVSGGYSVLERQEKPYAIVCDGNFKSEFDDVPIIKVKNARRALAIAYSREFPVDYDRLTVIGVTGTNGKTTTATLIHHILTEAGVTCGFIGTGSIKIGRYDNTPPNYTMTTPDPSMLYPLLEKMQEMGCKAVVMEISSHAIALEKIAGIVFELALFTNLTPEHMDFHTSIEEYFETKLRLLHIAKRCIVNIDDKYGFEAKKRLMQKAIAVGVIRQGDVYATDINMHALDGSDFYYRTDNYIFNISTALPGTFNIYNVLMSTAAAIEYGIKPCVAKRAVASFRCARGRMEKIHSYPDIIIDYAHTPFAFENALKTLKWAKKPQQKLIVVFGCGGNRDKYKRPQMGLVAGKYADYIILTEDNSRNEDTAKIVEDILGGIPCGAKYIVINDRKDAIIHALFTARENDIVAIIGKGHEEYKIDKAGVHQFSEREIVNAFYKGASK